MFKVYGTSEINEAVNRIRADSSLKPAIGLVLGSGLSALAEEVVEPTVVPFSDIPHFPSATVFGHSGRLLLGTLEGVPIAVMQGRVHFYEGYTMQQVTFPIRVLRGLGADTLILTNAAGGVNPSFSTGDLMLITDHINFVGMAGMNPLRGPNDPELGPRFPDMSKVYDRGLRELALRVASEKQIPLQQGIYVGLAGPTFETPADIRFLRLVGADAVGMSTVAEASVAKHGGMRVMGFSGISNVAISEPDSEMDTSHEEVLEAGRFMAPRLAALIRGVLRGLAEQQS
jgi:purine-nucleoside phosphorylase